MNNKVNKLYLRFNIRKKAKYNFKPNSIIFELETWICIKFYLYYMSLNFCLFFQLWPVKTINLIKK